MRFLYGFLTIAILGMAYLTLTSSKERETMTNPDIDFPVVTLKTSMGDIKVGLYPDKAPLTVQNFLKYVNNGHYDGTIFHRVIENFMIQGGGFTADLNQKKSDAPIQNEAGNGLKNKRGTLAMARTQDVHSATAQFFINVKDNDFLDYKSDHPSEFGYCVFGEVIEGMDVVDKISGVETTSKGPYRDLPASPIEIVSATVN